MKVEQLQLEIICSLREHVAHNAKAQKKPTYFSRILAILPKLRTLSAQGLQRILFLVLEDRVPAPPVIGNILASSLLS